MNTQTKETTDNTDFLPFRPCCGGSGWLCRPEDLATKKDPRSPCPSCNRRKTCFMCSGTGERTYGRAKVHLDGTRVEEDYVGACCTCRGMGTLKMTDLEVAEQKKARTEVMIEDLSKKLSVHSKELTDNINQLQEDFKPFRELNFLLKQLKGIVDKQLKEIERLEQLQPA